MQCDTVQSVWEEFNHFMFSDRVCSAFKKLVSEGMLECDAVQALVDVAGNTARSCIPHASYSTLSPYYGCINVDEYGYAQDPISLSSIPLEYLVTCNDSRGKKWCFDVRQLNLYVTSDIVAHPCTREELPDTVISRVIEYRDSNKMAIMFEISYGEGKVFKVTVKHDTLLGYILCDAYLSIDQGDFMSNMSKYSALYGNREVLNYDINRTVESMKKRVSFCSSDLYSNPQHGRNAHLLYTFCEEHGYEKVNGKREEILELMDIVCEGVRIKGSYNMTGIDLHKLIIGDRPWWQCSVKVADVTIFNYLHRVTTSSKLHEVIPGAKVKVVTTRIAQITHLQHIYGKDDVYTEDIVAELFVTRFINRGKVSVVDLRYINSDCNACNILSNIFSRLLVLPDGIEKVKLVIKTSETVIHRESLHYAMYRVDTSLITVEMIHDGWYLNGLPRLDNMKHIVEIVLASKGECIYPPYSQDILKALFKIKCKDAVIHYINAIPVLSLTDFVHTILFTSEELWSEMVVRDDERASEFIVELAYYGNSRLIPKEIPYVILSGVLDRCSNYALIKSLEGHCQKHIVPILTDDSLSIGVKSRVLKTVDLQSYDLCVKPITDNISCINARLLGILAGTSPYYANAIYATVAFRRKIDVYFESRKYCDSPLKPLSNERGILNIARREPELLHKMMDVGLYVATICSMVAKYAHLVEFIPTSSLGFIYAEGIIPVLKYLTNDFTTKPHERYLTYITTNLRVQSAVKRAGIKSKLDDILH